MDRYHRSALPICRTRVNGRRFSLFLAVLFVFAAQSRATTIRRFSLDQLRDRAHSVVVGTVVSTSHRADPHFPTIDYQVRVGEVLRGKAPGATMLVSYLVGEAAPHLVEGKTYVFFMGPEATHSTVGWAQGLYRIEKVNGEAVPLLISGDNQPLLITASGEMRRGSVVEIRDGKLKPKSASVNSWRVEGPSAPGTADRLPENAPPVSAVPPPAVVQSAAQTTRYATLDDLRSFVRRAGTSHAQ